MLICFVSFRFFEFKGVNCSSDRDINTLSPSPRAFVSTSSASLMSSVYHTQREAYRHKLMFELMFREEEQVDLKRYIRAFVSVVRSAALKRDD